VKNGIIVLRGIEKVLAGRSALVEGRSVCGDDVSSEVYVCRDEE
jgi:hypothetical protein